MKIIEARKEKAKFAEVLYALGMPHVGRDTARLIAEEVKSFSQLQTMTAAELSSIPQVGEKTAAAIYEFLHPTRPAQTPFVLANLIKHVKALQANPKSIHVNPRAEVKRLEEIKHRTLFWGKSVVVTGSFEGFNRETIEERLRELGATVKPSVNAKVDFLIAGATTKGNSKVNTARNLGVRIVEEAELMREIKEQ